MRKERFTMCQEQNDINGWTMSIVDWETKESFNELKAEYKQKRNE